MRGRHHYLWPVGRLAGEKLLFIIEIRERDQKEAHDVEENLYSSFFTCRNNCQRNLLMSGHENVYARHTQVMKTGKRDIRHESFCLPRFDWRILGEWACLKPYFSKTTGCTFLNQDQCTKIASRSVH